MALLGVVTELAVVVATMLVAATLVIVGPRQLLTALSEFRWRIRACTLPLAVLGAVLGLRWSTQDLVPRLSWRVLGNNVTPHIFSLERTLFGTNPVAVIQSYQSPELTAVFAFIYLYGYAFLLIFPFIAYFALDEMDDFGTLVLAFTANYALGLVCYVLFIAYGPRNLDPVLFEGLLYDAMPQAYYLTNTVNENTNVFPSLHTSLSVTVFVMAWLTREKYPLWVPVSGTLAVGVALSTMYLGIHWFTDVVAGTLLAALSIYIARNYTIDGLLESARRFLATQVQRLGQPDGK